MYNINSTPTTDTAQQTPGVSYAQDAQKAQSAAAVKDGNKTEEKSAEKQKASVEEVDAAVSDLNEALDSLNVKREFKVDDSTNEVVVKIIDKDDQQVIKQIPTEDAIKLSKNVKEMVGLLFDSTS